MVVRIVKNTVGVIRFVGIRIGELTVLALSVVALNSYRRGEGKKNQSDRSSGDVGT